VAIILTLDLIVASCTVHRDDHVRLNRREWSMSNMALPGIQAETARAVSA
jgi:hypothetical protein